MFNALKYSKELEDAGFSRAQAEAAINVFFRFMEHGFATKKDLEVFATKADLFEVRDAVHKIEVEMSEMRHGLISLEHKLTVKMGLMLAAGLSALAAILKLV